MGSGRIYSRRCQGKLVFYDLKADGEKIQVSLTLKSTHFVPD